MARSGLSKDDVKQARDVLIAQGKYPSVDAVRIVLGNTGSKSTIHKYLKELDEEYGIKEIGQPAVSDVLQGLIAGLADQLQLEANQQLEVLKQEFMDAEKNYQQQLAALHNQVNTLLTDKQLLDVALAEQHQQHVQTCQALQQENLSCQLLQRQLEGLQQLGVEKDQHIQSLEEKHKHGQKALEHYRAAVKEQRDQDLRRHDQQVQQLQAEGRHLQQSIVIKQDELTRANTKNAELGSELHALQQQLGELKQLREVNQHLTEQVNRIPVFEQTLQSQQLVMQEKQLRIDELYKGLAAKDQIIGLLQNDVQQLTVQHSALKLAHDVLLAEKNHQDGQAVAKNIVGE
jgi:chromosome segregation ATPase